MILISHRGNITGPDEKNENNPKYVDEAMKQGFEVEIDVWHKDNQFFLGHSKPQYPVDEIFLKNKKLWCHAKSFDALQELLKIEATGTLNTVSGISYSFIDIINFLESTLGFKLEIFSKKRTKNKVDHTYSNKYHKKLLPDFKYTDLKTGLKQLCYDFKKE